MLPGSRKTKKARTLGPKALALGQQLKGAAAFEKDQGELDLEEAVFGRSTAGKASIWDVEEDIYARQDEEEQEIETGLERLRDENVSFFALYRRGDHGVVLESCRPVVWQSMFVNICMEAWVISKVDKLRGSEFEADLNISIQLFFVDVPTASTSAEPFASSSGSIHSSDSDSDSDSPVVKTVNRRKAAWYDPADEDLTVSLKDVTRLRKLRVNPGEDIVGGLEYEGRLRRQ